MSKFEEMIVMSATTKGVKNVALSVRLGEARYDQFRDFCRERNLSMNKVVIALVDELLDKATES